MALVGRRREIAEVSRLLDRVAAGHGGHLIVTGPAGSGKTALTRVAVEEARSRLMTTAVLFPGSAGPHPLPPGEAAGPRLIVLEDVSGLPELDRLIAGPTAVLVTAREPLGVPPEIRLAALPEPALAELLPGQTADGVHAIWLASGGLPGPALDLAVSVSGLPSGTDPVTGLALTLPSRAEFLQLDTGLLRLLTEACGRAVEPGPRARLLARLARELLGDPSAAARRRELVDEAALLAEKTGDPEVIAEVLDHRLHALWDPAAARERLATAAGIVERARAAGSAELERRGLFWSFIAGVELGDLERAETALIAYARAGELAGDAEAAVVVPARQAMLAIVRGRFDTALALADEVAERGRRSGLADTGRLTASLRGRVALIRGQAGAAPEELLAIARRLPGHFYEASAARALAELGRDAEAVLELERVLPATLAGSGPRWLGAVADLAVVAARSGTPEAARALHDALLPYRGRLVIWGGANTVTGPVDDYLGRLALRLGDHARALSYLDDAIAVEQRIGALPWLAESLAFRSAALTARAGAGDAERAAEDLARSRELAKRLGLAGRPAAGSSHQQAVDPLSVADESAGKPQWRLVREHDGWRLDAGAESAWLRDARGAGFLRTLLAAPGLEIAALDLVAGGAGLRLAGGGPMLDATALRAYRRRLAELDEQLAAADRAGDPDRGTAVQAERSALVAELRRATGTGGRTRAVSDEAERARVNATRAIRAVVRSLESDAPLAAAHLTASLRTGRTFRYQPAPGGPARWHLG